jgi:recombinational DNA repair ATPase RecF
MEGKTYFVQKMASSLLPPVIFREDQKKYNDILKKFEGDLKGVSKNGASGMAFITNQELKNSERKKLEKKAGSIKLDLFHLERIALILNSPQGYAVRREFLDIEMNEEEKVAHAPHD